MLFRSNLADAWTVTDGTDEYIKIVSTTGADEVKILQNLDVSGNITLTGTVDGRDIATDGNILDNLNTTLGLGSLAAVEVTQLGNINSTTISTTQWGYLGATDQALASTDLVTFAQLTVDQVVINDGTITYSGTTGNNKVVVGDNLADAWTVTEIGRAHV